MPLRSTRTAPVLTTSFLAATLLADASAQAQEPALNAVASFSVLADMASRVGGERVTVDALVGPNEDAHVFEPSPADAARLGEADIVIVNGLGFEGFIDRLIEVSETGAAVVTVSDGIEPLSAGEDAHHDEHGEGEHEEGHHDEDHHGDGEHDDHDTEDGHDDHHGEAHDDQKGHEDGHRDHDERAHGEEAHDEHDHHDHGPNDPHAWHSLDHAQTYVTAIADAFCATDAQGCESYRANAESYRGELAALDAEIHTLLDGVPEGERTVITSHDAFGYLADAYGLTMLAPQGLSTEAEASAADVARLIDQIRADGAAAIFVENVANSRLIERIAAETGLQIGGRLYGDALSGADGPAATYIDMMRHNTTAIGEALLAR